MSGMSLWRRSMTTTGTRATSRIATDRPRQVGPKATMAPAASTAVVSSMAA